jgi:uncharacterized protein (DUF433 family)
MSSDCRENENDKSPALIEVEKNLFCARDDYHEAANLGLEEELRELAEEYAPKTARERSLVASIVLAERELRKLDKLSRLSATPCDSAAFTRSFNSARNAKDQANKAFDRLRAAAEMTHASEPTAKTRKKKKAEAEPAPRRVAEYRPIYPNEPRLRDTPYQVGDITSMLEDGWPEADILQACPSLTAEDVKFCREQLETKGPWHAHPQYDSWPPKAASALVLLIGFLFGLFLAARGLLASSSAPAGATPPAIAVTAVGVSDRPGLDPEAARPSTTAGVVRDSAYADQGLRQRRATPMATSRIDLVAIRREKADNPGIESGPGRHSQASPRRSRALDARSRRWKADVEMGDPSG